MPVTFSANKGDDSHQYWGGVLCSGGLKAEEAIANVAVAAIDSFIIVELFDLADVMLASHDTVTPQICHRISHPR